MDFKDWCVYKEAYMKLRDIIKKIVYKWQYHKIKRLITLKGKKYEFGPTAHISLSDGSGKSDIILNDNIRLFGTLLSQSHGKITIGKNCTIGRNAKISCVDKVSIGKECEISEACIVCDSNNHPLSVLFRRVRSINYRKLPSLHLYKYSSHKPIIIQDNVWIGERARICKGVTIGKNSVIGANSVVTKDIPANCIAAGNPARVVKTDIDKLPDPTDCAEFNAFIEKHGTDF